MKRIAFERGILSITVALCILGFTSIAQDPPTPLPEDSVQANISVSFANPSENELRAAQWMLARVNADRVAAGYEPYSTVANMCIGHMKRALINWQRLEAEAKREEQSIADLWKAATDAQRAAAIAALTQ